MIRILRRILGVYYNIKLNYEANNKIKKGGNKIKFKNRNSKRIFLLQTPEHRNLGDHAIAYAQLNFCEKYFPKYEIVEIPYENVYESFKDISQNIKSKDLIMIIGGGNMGDMYIYEEIMRRNIIKFFKNNIIISMPQTISFSNTLLGKYEMKKSAHIYNKNKNLILVAREPKSFEIMKKVFVHNKVIMTPDIVLSINKKIDLDRSKVVTCIRNDIESYIGIDLKNDIMNILRKHTDEVIITDTLKNYDIKINDRQKELNKIWKLFSESKLVITDRLHGMIFSAITGTPCLVLKNSNHKIEESYKKWLSNIDNIELIDDYSIENLELKISEFLVKKENKDDNERIDFSNLVEEIREFVR